MTTGMREEGRLPHASALPRAPSCERRRVSVLVRAPSCGRRRLGVLVRASSCGAAGRVPLGERGDSSVEGPLSTEAGAPVLRASPRSPGHAVTRGVPPPPPEWRNVRMVVSPRVTAAHLAAGASHPASAPPGAHREQRKSPHASADSARSRPPLQRRPVLTARPGGCGAASHGRTGASRGRDPWAGAAGIAASWPYGRSAPASPARPPFRLSAPHVARLRPRPGVPRHRPRLRCRAASPSCPPPTGR